MASRIRLHFYQCPGDTLVATGAVECLMRQYPGRFLVDVSGNDAEAVFENNPHRTKLDGPDVETILMENPLINQADYRPVHFLESYCLHLGNCLGLPIECTVNRPYVYVSDEEKAWLGQVQELTGQPVKYWLVCSGYKNDYTVKNWGHDNYQAIVDKLRGRVQFVQVGRPEHNHRPLAGVIDLVGKTDTRQLIRLAYHAQGGLGPESFLHHLFAALGKPFVCLASGFLPRSWVSYPTSTILTRQGCLPCSRDRGCWKARTVRLNDGDGKDGSLCQLPVFGSSEPVPKCLAMIGPEEVCRAIEAYYLGGLLTF